MNKKGISDQPNSYYTYFDDVSILGIALLFGRLDVLVCHSGMYPVAVTIHAGQ